MLSYHCSVYHSQLLDGFCRLNELIKSFLGLIGIDISISKMYKFFENLIKSSRLRIYTLDLFGNDYNLITISDIDSVSFY